MSRMVRESRVSGLRERHWFARVMLKELQAGIASERPRGDLLAFRGAILFHLYSALVGMMREVAKGHGLSEQVDGLMALPAIRDAFADVHSPEMVLLSEALDSPSDPIAWLQAEILEASAASGLARRAFVPAQDDGLSIKLEDPNIPLAEGDIARLQTLIDRVQTILEDGFTHMQEW